MNWREIAKEYAPALALAVAPPFGAIAAGAVKIALELTEDATEAQVATAMKRATPEQIASLRQAEMDFLIKREEYALAQSKIDADDRASARDREAKLAAAGVKDSTTRNLAYLIVCSGLAMAAAMMAGLSKIDSVVAGTVLGYVMSEMKQVSAYYFGSSSGSARKTELIGNTKTL